MASSLHDIGKIGISDTILLKNGPLDPEERRAVELHTTIGASMLEDSPSQLLETASEIALTHHENWDGSGYPRQLKGDEIPLSGRMVRLADQYDALRSERTYKKAYTHDRAKEIILQGDKRTQPAHFDPKVLELFGEMHADFAEIAASISS
jgi:putative two-component system response regulator